MNIALSELDTKHFGYNIARTNIKTKNEIKSVDDYCNYNNITMVIARCDAEMVQDLLDNGFEKQDEIVYYKKFPVVPVSFINPLIRTAGVKDTLYIENIARRAFTNYMGHYHTDKKIDQVKATEAYVNWALSGNMHKVVYDDFGVKGFALIDIENNNVSLYAVDENAQGQGIGKSLINAALNLCTGKMPFTMTTQSSNLKSINVWKRLGLEYSHSVFTFHKWYK